MSSAPRQHSRHLKDFLTNQPLRDYTLKKRKEKISRNHVPSNTLHTNTPKHHPRLIKTTYKVDELTDHLHVADLVDDGDHVHLTHVVASVRGFNVAYVQRPGGGVVPRDTEPRDECDGSLVYGEQHLAIQVHPRHL